jgi:hypothetical protein
MTIKGIRILHVESDSPAEEAGLRAGDRKSMSTSESAVKAAPKGISSLIGPTAPIRAFASRNSGPGFATMTACSVSLTGFPRVLVQASG